MRARQIAGTASVRGMSVASDRPPDTASVVPSAGFQYYRDRYWNDIERVVRTLNERATGDAGTSWFEHLRDNYGPFRHALVLNCGNGWVERELVARGVVKSALGVDVSDELLDQARAEAAKAALPLRYERLDTNAADFPAEDFDLVVNHAAMHHVAYVDRVTRRICELLAPDGVFVSWDFVGPHRNQYTALQWERAWDTNLALPEELRQDMRYPHLPTMLAGDPSEAVHSELIVPTIERYFRIEHHARVGGGVGYLLLTHNQAIHSRTADEIDEAVRIVMDADAALTAAHPESTLFAYIVARPDRDSLADPDRLAAWTAEEDERERRAAAAGGVYYPPTAIAALSDAILAAQNELRAEVLATTPARTLARVLADRVRRRLPAKVRERITRR
jgi:SAM-dependent methyltransferase